MHAPTERAARLALPALLLGAVGIAFAPIFVRLSETGPLATGFWRMALSVPALLLLAGWQRAGSADGALGADGASGAGPTAAPAPGAGRGAERGGARAGRGDGRALVFAGLFFAGDLGLWHLAIGRTSIANATLLPNLAPIFVTLGGFLFLAQRVSRRFLVALALALAGVWTLVGSSADLGGRRVEGDLLGVGTAVFYAAYILAVADLRGRRSTASILWAAGAAACVPLLLLALLSGEALLPATPQGWLVLAGLALVSQVTGQGLIAYALAHLPAAFSSLTLLLQPVCATLLAWWLFAESLGALQALGGAVVLVGVVLARLASRPPGHPRTTAPPGDPLRPPARPPSPS
jgi:drug/metabolite transporter (DMT)-like permease